MDNPLELKMIVNKEELGQNLLLIYDISSPDINLSELHILITIT